MPSTDVDMTSEKKHKKSKKIKQQTEEEVEQQEEEAKPEVTSQEEDHEDDQPKVGVEAKFYNFKNKTLVNNVIFFGIEEEEQEE